VAEESNDEAELGLTNLCIYLLVPCGSDGIQHGHKRRDCQCWNIAARVVFAMGHTGGTTRDVPVVANRSRPN
jgi:hypothetical protein